MNLIIYSLVFVQTSMMTSLQLTAKEEMVERFLDAAARGDVTQVSTLLSQVPSVLNQSGHSGWTALMLASRNGHYEVVKMLLSHGYVSRDRKHKNLGSKD